MKGCMHEGSNQIRLRHCFVVGLQDNTYSLEGAMHSGPADVGFICSVQPLQSALIQPSWRSMVWLQFSRLDYCNTNTPSAWVCLGRLSRNIT